MKKYFKLYRMFLAQYLKGLMEYRVDFFIGLLGFFLVQATGIIFIYLIFQRIPNLNGWSFYQVMFIYGFAQLPRGLDHMFTDNLWALSGRIVAKGEFDKYLLRPINPLFHLIAEVFQPDAFGEIIVGIFLVAVAAGKLGISFSILNILFFILVIVFSTIVYTSIKIIFASLAFWIKYSQAIVYMVYSLSDFAKYPIKIYAGWLQKILTFIIPFAFTAYFPAGYFIGKINFVYAAIGTVLAGVLSFMVAYLVWLQGIKVYESSGS
ncbi:ABC transporter permease [Haliovirga abyssi]|uniref:Multidrug ABC transporter permease n=1 Tax=Haliovirga abyssi TaxID=2996794 RepID=A0AAU9D8C0_9FUSO|nr:ABC-2 family transporter protein [Haliovirga abyssi]BDU49495.1 multidrug ABC transporter permease [Haliovirga abyssi]